VWASGLVVESYGLKIGIRCSRPQMPEGVRDALPPGCRDSNEEEVNVLLSFIVGGEGARPGIRNYHMLYFGMQRIARTMSLPELYEALENHTQLTVGEWAHDRVFLHAGVVGWKGRAIILPGRSHAGKSTLVRALLDAGAEYYSDEYAVVDKDGNVHPYPRRLSLRRPDDKLPDRPTPADLGVRVGLAPLQAGLILFSQYQPDAPACWKPQRLSAGQTCLKLVDHAVAAQSRPEHVMDGVHTLSKRLPAFKSIRGDARTVVPDLLKQLDSLPLCA